MCIRSQDLKQENMEEQTEVRAPEVELPEVEVPLDLDDEYTPEVDGDRQIWWFVESLVENKLRYCKESKRRRWFYRTRFVGHGPDKDCWLTSDKLDCTDSVHPMHGLEPLAPSRGSNASSGHKSSDIAAIPDMRWSQFFRRSGGAFMRVLDNVLEDLAHMGWTILYVSKYAKKL